MRDYQFGDWLSSLRISNGYSQFQLGKLLGVSDKAVSKWETGAAKPRTETCVKLAALYGVSLDELMTCRQQQDENGMDNEQNKWEEPLWREAREALRRIYGEHPPLAILSRLDAEEMLLRGTGMIRHMKLFGKLWRRGVQKKTSQTTRFCKAPMRMCSKSCRTPRLIKSACPICFSGKNKQNNQSPKESAVWAPSSFHLSG